MLLACFPLGPVVTSKLTFCPSLSDLNPCMLIAEKCANRSSPPSSGVMNPYPFASLNHLTVPVAIVLLPSRMNERVLLFGQQVPSAADERGHADNRNSSHLGAKRCFFKRRIPMPSSREPGKRV